MSIKMLSGRMGSVGIAPTSLHCGLGWQSERSPRGWEPGSFAPTASAGTAETAPSGREDILISIAVRSEGSMHEMCAARKMDNVKAKCVARRFWTWMLTLHFVCTGSPFSLGVVNVPDELLNGLRHTEQTSSPGAWFPLHVGLDFPEGVLNPLSIFL
jgi:hypothetical protein